MSSDLRAGALSGCPESNGGAGGIFYSKLNFFGHSLACDFGNDTKPKINTGGHTTSGNYISIFHHSCLFVCSSDEGQKIRVSPVRRSPTPLQKPAIPKTNAPVQTDVTYFAARACRHSRPLYRGILTARRAILEEPEIGR